MSPTPDAPVEPVDALLVDGGLVRLEGLGPADEVEYRAFLERLSPETLHRRFLTPRPRGLSEREIRWFLAVDQVARVALAAWVEGRIVAVGRFDRDPVGGGAEVAFAVEDAQQGRGIGTLLLEHLVDLARGRGITVFAADVMADNHRMLDVFRAAGFRQAERIESGVVQVVFPIEPTAASRAALEAREHAAERRSIERLLRPRSVAVIGASQRPGTIGHHLLSNLLRGGFDGPVFPVNPTATAVASVPAVARIADIAGPVDLAVIAVPAAAVPDVVDECAAKGVKGLVVISSGFSEVGPEGAELERQLVERAHRGGMRVVGPNCLGLADTTMSLDVTFSPNRAVAGPVAFLSQSGAVGIAVLGWTARRGLGISSFVAIGNRSDVSGNDLLQYWEDDDATEVVLLYLESFGNPRKFARLARRVGRRKPIVAVKAGRSLAGSRAASSHTAAAATPDVATDALFEQAGVIRVDTLGELLDVAEVLVTQPLPAGRRVAVVGNSGGPGILAADAAEAAGLDVVALPAELGDQLRQLLGPRAAVHNPVDMTAAAGPAEYEAAIGAVLDCAEVDAVVVIFTHALVADPDEVAAAVARAVEGAHKPVVASFLAHAEPPPPLRSDGVRVPVFPSPEPAAIALGRMARYAEWRRRDPGSVPTFADVDRGAARELVGAMLAAHPDGGWMDPVDAVALLGRFGIPVAETHRVETADDAVRVAEAVGWPVVAKVGGADVVHKTEVGGVRTAIADEAELRRAVAALRSGGGGEVVVQPQCAGDLEVIVGVVQDPGFGPLVLFGMGGVATDLLADRALRILPLTDRDASDLVGSLRSSPLLGGYRGSAVLDRAGVEDVVLRVAQLAEALPEVVELDLNPVLVSAEGVVAVDVKVRLAPLSDSRGTARRLD